MDYLSEIGSPKGKLSGTELFDDALFAGMEKFGAKGNKKAMQQYSDVLLENMTSPIQTIEDLVKSNDGARKEAGKLLEELSPASTMLDDDTLKLEIFYNLDINYSFYAECHMELEVRSKETAGPLFSEKIKL